MIKLPLKFWQLVYDAFWAIKPKPSRSDFSIGVVTYIMRFEEFFKPNLKRLVKSFPDVPIYVAVNGFHNESKQKNYIEKIITFCSQYNNVKLLIYTENQSLSMLWNKLILCAYPNGILLLNDDIVVLPFFRKHLEKTDIFELEMCTINRSWSHFWIKPEMIHKVGWFDERFPGIGEEDGDFTARLIMKEEQLHNINTNMLIHFDDKPAEVSWNSALGIHGGKYTYANRAFIMEKYHFSSEPAEGFKWVHICGQYMKLKNGHETPDFYPDIITAAEKIKMVLY